MYYVLNLASYYLYSGDLDFVRSQYAIVQRQLAYNRALVDPTTGLLISNSSERDWDFYDGGKPGAVTAYNAIYYKALTDAAYMASELGNTADAATYARRRPTSSRASTPRCSTPPAASTSWPTATTPTTPATRCRRTPTRRRSRSASRPRARTPAS